MCVGVYVCVFVTRHLKIAVMNISRTWKKYYRIETKNPIVFGCGQRSCEVSRGKNTKFLKTACKHDISRQQ